MAIEPAPADWPPAGRIRGRWLSDRTWPGPWHRNDVDGRTVCGLLLRDSRSDVITAAAMPSVEACGHCARAR